LHYIGTDTNQYWGLTTAGGSYISIGDTSLGTAITATSIVVGADKWFNVGFSFSDATVAMGALRIAFLESISVTFSAGSSSLKIDFREKDNSPPLATDASGNNETYPLTSGTAQALSSSASNKYYGSDYSTGRNSLYAAIAAGTAGSVTISALTVTYRC
jgi:hypothetical protein